MTISFYKNATAANTAAANKPSAYFSLLVTLPSETLVGVTVPLPGALVMVNAVSFPVTCFVGVALAMASLIEFPTPPLASETTPPTPLVTNLPKLTTVLVASAATLVILSPKLATPEVISSPKLSSPEVAW